MTRKIREDMEALSATRKQDFDEILDACAVLDSARIDDSSKKLAQVASNHFLAAFEFSYREIRREGPSQLLLCVGTELLLNAIVIQKQPRKYVEVCGNKKRPPTFEKIKACATATIVSDFDENQRDRMIDVLDLLQSKRNIFAHLSLGIHAYYYQHYEILNVICYLLDYYFPELRNESEPLELVKERFRPKHFSDYDYVAFQSIDENDC